MTAEELDFWQKTMDRWSKDAEELLNAPKGPLYGISFALGNNLRGLVTRLQKELDHTKKSLADNSVS